MCCINMLALNEESMMDEQSKIPDCSSEVWKNGNDPDAISSKLKLSMELDCLEELAKNFPDGCLIRVQIKAEIIENTDPSDFEWLKHLKMVYVSDGWFNLTNIPLQGARQDMALALSQIYPAEAKEIIPQMYRSFANLTLFNAEIPFRYSDTESRWVQLSTTPRREGICLIANGFILDITRRKQAEIELAVHRDELQQLVNRRTQEVEILNDELSKINEELLSASYEHAATNDELAKKDQMLNEEIVGRKEMLRQLKKTQSKMRRFLSQSFDGIIYYDVQGRIVEWNPAMERITGVKKEDVINRSMWDILWNQLPEEQRNSRTLDNMRNSYLEKLTNNRNHKPVVEEMSLLNLDGEIRHLRMSLFPITSDPKTNYGHIVRDVTQYRKAGMELIRYQKNLEKMVEEKTRELLVAKEKAEESDRLKSAFLANISHEIRTPLNGIIGLLNILSRDPGQPASFRECFGIINRNSEHLLKLIDDILDIAKIEAGQMAIRSEPVNIDDLMVELRLSFHSCLLTHNKPEIILEIVKDPENGENCLVYTDLGHLRQILNNLLSNAVKFTVKGYIRFGYAMKAINKSEGTVTLEFFVEDTGIGIPEDLLETVFERFYQVDMDNNRCYGGTGLGLTISRNLAELMGGYMYATKTDREGTKIVFTIECKPRVIH